MQLGDTYEGHINATEMCLRIWNEFHFRVAKLDVLRYDDSGIRTHLPTRRTDYHIRTAHPSFTAHNGEY